jgi:hypothetical protein
MPFTAADHDQVDATFLREAHHVGLDVAGLHDAVARAEPELRRQLLDALVGALDQLALDLHGGQQRLAHRFDRYVLDHVQQRQARAVALRDALRAFGDALAAFGEVETYQDLAVVTHRTLPACCSQL